MFRLEVRTSTMALAQPPSLLAIAATAAEASAPDRRWRARISRLVHEVPGRRLGDLPKRWCARHR